MLQPEQMRDASGKYSIVRDPVHGFYRVDPVPSEEEVARFYLEEFYSGEYKSFNDSSIEVQTAEQEFFDARWNAIYQRLTEILGDLKGKSVFDIGCGYCQALLYFKRLGLDPAGIEPSTEGSEYGTKEGVQVYQTDIENFDIVGEKRFDVVTLVNVLEHLRNPAQTLQQIKQKLLKTSGVLVIDVPNEFNDFQMIADAEYNLKNWWICPPNHINYFSANSLRSLLSACGYKVVHMESSFPLEIFMLFGEVYGGNGKLGKECHNKRVLFERLMHKYGKESKLTAFYKALADLDLGRQTVAFAVSV